MTTIEKIQNLFPEKQFGFALAPVYGYDPFAGLMAITNGRSTYLLDEAGQLSGLNLAGKELTQTEWEIILDTLGPETAHLRALNLCQNKLNNFDPPPGMTGLVWLDLSENQLMRIEALPGADQLEHLWIGENSKLESPPPDVVALGMEETIKWFAAKNKRPVLEAKVMFIGESEVGKTHLIEMLLHQAITRPIFTTHGIERSRIEDAPSAKGPIRLNVWDLGGQDFMRSTHQFFFTERTLYVVVTVARTQRKFLNHWLQLVREIGGNSPVLVVINKADSDQHDIDREPLKEEYSNIVDFVRTAIFDKPEWGVIAEDTIEELKTKIHRIVADREWMPDVFVEQRPEWFTVKEALESRYENDGVEYISYEEYCRMPQIHDLPENERRSNLKHLSTLGTVVSFAEDPRLLHMHVINPKWIMDGVYALINDPKVKEERKGEFSFTDFDRVLDRKRFPPEKDHFIVELMQRFRLCYPVRRKKDTYLLPDLFPDIQPQDAWTETGAMKFRLNYGTYPPDLFMTQFIVDRYESIMGEKRWRSGVVVTNKISEAIVRRSVANEHIVIEVAGPVNQRRQYLHTVLDVFGELHKPFDTLEIHREIPYKGFWLDYDDLLAHEEAGETMYNSKLKEKLPVSEILDGYRRPHGMDGHQEIMDGLKVLKKGQKAHRLQTKEGFAKNQKALGQIQQQLQALEAQLTTAIAQLQPEKFNQLKELLEGQPVPQTEQEKKTLGEKIIQLTNAWAVPVLQEVVASGYYDLLYGLFFGKIG